LELSSSTFCVTVTQGGNCNRLAPSANL
jgi:hypothetical protein